MDNFSRVCTLEDHDQKTITHVCVYEHCISSRFLSPNCILDGTPINNQIINRSWIKQGFVKK